MVPEMTGVNSDDNELEGKITMTTEMGDCSGNGKGGNENSTNGNGGEQIMESLSIEEEAFAMDVDKTSYNANQTWLYPR